MKTIKFIIAVALSLGTSNVNACTQDRAAVIKNNTYLMSEPSKKSQIILKLPKNFDDLRGCIASDLSSKEYKVDKSGTQWNYVYTNLNNREIKGWVMSKRIKVITHCCQS
jgi:hypothetical protein